MSDKPKPMSEERFAEIEAEAEACPLVRIPKMVRELLTEVRRLRSEIAEYRALARAAARFEPGYDETEEGFVRRLAGIYNRHKEPSDG